MGSIPWLSLLQLVHLATSWFGTAHAQGNSVPYHLTTDVLNPGPIPGNPFTITWTGGTDDSAVYIVLVYLFPDTPDQDIPYGNTDILSNAPNNGSWTWHVPKTIEPGRYELSIGQNPILLSDSTPVFTFSPSQVSIPPTTSSPEFAPTQYNPNPYRGCGLPPLPDYTYTGYQPPCLLTTDGRTSTIWPIVPASDSSIFFPPGATYTYFETLASDPFLTQASSTAAAAAAATASATATAATVVANGYAQALQCSTDVTPSLTSVFAGGVTTIFSEVACGSPAAAGTATTEASGSCHLTGDYAFTETSQFLCCPNGWLHTPFASQAVWCYSATPAPAARLARRDESNDAAPSTPAATTLTGGTVLYTEVAFARAGTVTQASMSVSASGATSQSSSSSSAAGSGGSRVDIGRSGWVVSVVSFALIACMWIR